MCGIVGVFYKGDDGPGPVGQVLTAMCDRLFRRGPDSAGVALYGSPIDRGLVVRVDLERRDAEQAGGRRAELQRTHIRRRLRCPCVKPGFCHHCHTGRGPVGMTTQDPELMERLEVDEAADHVFNFLQSMTMEMMFARACGNSAVHDLEPEDMRALTLETSLIAGIPLAGTDVTLRPDDIATAVAARLAGGDRDAGF